MYIATNEIINNLPTLFLGIFFFWQSLIPVAANLLFGGNKGGGQQGGYVGPPPVPEASAEEKALLSGQPHAQIQKAFTDYLPQYKTQMDDIYAGNLPPSWQQNWEEGISRPMSKFWGDRLAKLAGTNTIGSSSVAAGMRDVNDAAANSFATNKLALTTMLGDQTNKRFALTSDNLKYPQTAWNTMYNNRYTNANAGGYQQAGNNNQQSSFMQGLGGLFNFGGGSSSSSSSSSGGYDPNFFSSYQGPYSYVGRG